MASWFLGICALWWVFPAMAAGLAIETTLDEGQCSASVTNPSIALGANGKIDPASALGKSWVFLEQTELDVSLVCSAGFLKPSAPTPALKITPKAGTAELGVEGLFASTATGFGVAIGKTLGGSLTSATLVTTAAPYVDLPDNGVSNGAAYKLPVGLACGDAGDCTAAKLSVGPVSATFLVDFVYH